MKEERCPCGSVQFTYSGKCLSCKITKEERKMMKELLKESNLIEIN